MDCALCESPPPNHAHHMKTKGSGGDDRLENLLPLCGKCHLDFHNRGKGTWEKQHGDRARAFRLKVGLP